MLYKYGSLFFSFLLVCQFSYAQSGCTDPAANNYNPTAVINDGSCVYGTTTNNPVLRGVMNSIITESSGVVWTDGKLWTHNDSGNPAEIYSIDTTNGQTLQTVVIDNYPNVDWEDITADSAYIYVSDCGNNNGSRRDQKVLKIAKSSIGAATTVHVNAQAINISYTDQTSYTPSSTNNFDCESIISIKDSLYIFTKDRGDLAARVYKMPKAPGTYALTPYTSFATNGLITGADYNPVTKEIVLIGYQQGHLNSFLWILNDFKGDMFFSGNKRKILIGNGQEWQTEGVCYIDSNRFFISCESAGIFNASLFVTNNTWKGVKANGINKLNLNYVNVYPNPSAGMLHVVNMSTKGTYALTNMQGKCMQQGHVNAGNTDVNISKLPPAMYEINIAGDDGSIAVLKVVKQ